MKRDTLVIVGNIILFILLAALFVVEIKNPQGGAAMLSSMFGTM